MAKTLEEFYAQIKLDATSASKLSSHFQEQVDRALADRTELEDRWTRAHELFEGIRPPKNHPWEGASNVHLPIVSSHVAALHSRFMTTLFAPEPFWAVRARNPENKGFADSATEYLDWARSNMFEWYVPVRSWSLDAIKLGIGILKITWQRRRGPVYRYNDDYEIVSDEVVIEDRPHVEAIPPNKFVWPAGYPDIQTCPWVCHIIDYTPGDLKRLAREDFFRPDGVKLALGAETSDPRDNVDRRQDELAGVSVTNKPVVTVYDIWGRYDVNNDGLEEEINVTIEPTTGAILRLNPIPYFHRKRPFVVGRLEPRAHRIDGQSVADQIGDLNEEANTVHNQTVDATTVSVCQMFGVRAGSPAEAALDNIHPGKKVPFSQDTDIKEIGLGPLKANSLPLEELVRIYSERRTGISDFSFGREPNPSRRGTATGTLAIIQEGNKKFDFQVRDLRDALGQAGMMILSMFQQMNPSGVALSVLGPDAVEPRSLVVRFPDQPLEQAVSVEVVAGTSTINRQSKRQDSIALFQILMSVYQQALQLGQLLAQPGLPPPFIQLAIEVARGAGIMTRDIIQSFEERRHDELIPDLEEIYAQIGLYSLSQGAAGAAGLPGAPGGVQEAGPGGSQQGGERSAGPPSRRIPVAGSSGSGAASGLGAMPKAG